MAPLSGGEHKARHSADFALRSTAPAARRSDRRARSCHHQAIGQTIRTLKGMASLFSWWSRTFASPRPSPTALRDGARKVARRFANSELEAIWKSFTNTSGCEIHLDHHLQTRGRAQESIIGLERACVGLRRRRRAREGKRRRDQDRVMNDMSGLYADLPGRFGRGRAWRRGLRRRRQGAQGRDCRADHRTSLISVPTSCAPGSTSTRSTSSSTFRPRRSRWVTRSFREKKQSVPRSAPRLPTSPREVLAELPCTGPTTPGARQRHRQCDREDRRRHLVLPDRRLPFATRSRAIPGGGGREKGGKWWEGTPSVPGTDFSSFLLRPGLQGQDHRARQSRRRYHQLDQAGSRVWDRQGRAEPCRTACVHQ